MGFFWLVVYGLLFFLPGWLRFSPAAAAVWRCAAPAVFWAALLFFLRRRGRLRRYGLCRISLPARRAGIALAPLALSPAVNMAASAAFGLSFAQVTPSAAVQTALLAFGEEFFFRGWLLSVLEGRLGRRGAAAATAAAFGLAHFVNVLSGAAPGAAAVQAACAGCFGLALAASRFACGSVWPAAAAHILTNLTALPAGPAAAAANRAAALSCAAGAFYLGYGIFLLHRMDAAQNQK